MGRSLVTTCGMGNVVARWLAPSAISDEETNKQKTKTNRPLWRSNAARMVGWTTLKLCVEVARLKTRIFERIMSWLDLGCLDGEESRPLSDGEDLALIRMSISLGNVPKTTTSVRQTLLPMRTSNYWLPVPLVAFASDMLDASIVVWKPAGDGSRIRIYSNGHTRGVFFRIDAKSSHHTRIFSPLVSSEIVFRHCRGHVHAREHDCSTICSLLLGSCSWVVHTFVGGAWFCNDASSSFWHLVFCTWKKLWSAVWTHPYLLGISMHYIVPSVLFH